MLKGKARTPTAVGGFGSFTTSSTTLSYLTPPPDFSGLPQDVVVPFKNLLKKAGTTREKAIQDILAFAQGASPGYDGSDSVIEIFSQLYPRLSIDDSRRVRETSHQLLLHFMNTSQKQMAKRLPSVVGPWLAGTFDRDKVVGRTASEGLSSMLQTREKENKFWKSVQTFALDFAIEAIKETPDSLSDERSTTKQDSEAKYDRVVGASLSLVLHLIKRGNLEPLESGLEKYADVDALWTMAKSNDAFVRRTFFQLLQTSVESKLKFVESRLSLVGRALVSDGLKHTQSGSATQLVCALISVTKSYARVWGTQKHALQRLQQFVSRGSQGGTEEYWVALDELLSALSEQPPPTLEELSGFLESLKAGILNRLETRQNKERGFQTHAKALIIFLEKMAPTPGFLDANFYPWTRQYIFRPSDSQFPILNTPETLIQLWFFFAQFPAPEIQASVAQEWSQLSATFISKLGSLLPEVSEGYKESQKTITDQADRWFATVEAFAGSAQFKTSSLQDVISSASLDIVKQAIQLLLSRNYKPYGASLVIRSAITRYPALFGGIDILADLFPVDKLGYLATSQSLEYLAPHLPVVLGQDSPRFKGAWLQLVESAMQISSQILRLDAMRYLLQVPSVASLAQSSLPLQNALVSVWREAVEGAPFPNQGWLLLKSTLYGDVLSGESLKEVADTIVDALVEDKAGTPALAALELIIDKNKAAVFSEDPSLYPRLITNLLTLTEVSDAEVSEKANRRLSALSRQAPVSASLVKIFKAQLSDANPSSLDITTLVCQADVQLASGELSVEEILPDPVAWDHEVSQLLSQTPDPSLALSREDLLYFLIRDSTDSHGPLPSTDKNGRSICVRKALFTAKLLSSEAKRQPATPERTLELLRLLCVTCSLAEDEILLPPWSHRSLCVEKPGSQEAANQTLTELIRITRDVVSNLVLEAKGWDIGGSSVNPRLIEPLIRAANGASPSAFYASKALGQVLRSALQTYGFPPKFEEWVSSLGVMKLSSDSVFTAAAFLRHLVDDSVRDLTKSRAVSNLCAGLISEIPSLNPDHPRTLPRLILLDLCLQLFGSQVPGQTHKLVIAVQKMASWTKSPGDLDYRLVYSMCAVILRLLGCPGVKDVYGVHWEQLVDFCFQTWDMAARNADKKPDSERFCSVLATLRLYVGLEAIAEPNDDLVEALEGRQEARSAALIALLESPRSSEECISRRKADAILYVVCDSIPLVHLKDHHRLYASVASTSPDVQKAAFSLLHRVLPTVQEEINFHVVMENTVATLHPELLGLLVPAPDPREYSDEDLAKFPTNIRSYLFAWVLVFDCYSKASYRVRSDYTEAIKQGGHLKDLLYFSVEVLGHTQAVAPNLLKEGFTHDHIRDFRLDDAATESELRVMHWLLIHLFYLVLKYIPSLYRAWYRDISAKQVKNSTESWMTKYFSPLLMQETFDEVAAWTAKQKEGDSGEEKLIVKLNKGAWEITLGYPIDEEEATIVLRVPSSFPLDPVDVLSAKRVGIKADKWEAWLKRTKALIMFGDGNIIDGVEGFRRNMNLAVKDQEECAICYSIISPDKALPDKRCPTCNHMYHRHCLYKWFENSARNTCPLCRNLIGYIGSDKRK